MSIKTLPLFCVFVIVSQITSGCSWIKDRAKTQASFQNENLDLSCLTALPDQLQVLFEGRYTESTADQQKQSQIVVMLSSVENTPSSSSTHSAAGIKQTMWTHTQSSHHLPSSLAVQTPVHSQWRRGK